MISRRHALRLSAVGTFAFSPFAALLGCGDTDTNPHEDPEPSPAPPDDPSKPWWLRQNFAPVEESESFELSVEGSIPSALSGLYLRNGPNPLHNDSIHWFVGDGMMHGLRLEA